MDGASAVPHAKPVDRRRPHLGQVAAFDDDRGLGLVTDDDGATFGFHCTAVADGSRHVEVGAPVAFVVAPGLGGRLEARGLVKLPLHRAG